ncbi:MAG TPA: cytochrome c oxidase subunit II [Bacteroidota bacterium]|jgi:cytochrome c oxidase subunit 2|nr:cytochrome c oxidase subunit II [Bacteroidota bacterium]
MWNFPLLPDRASTIAEQVDALYWFIFAVVTFFSLIILVALIYSAIRYRKGSKASRAGAHHENLPLELIWSLGPLAIALLIFVWSSKLFIDMRVAPKDAMEIYVVGKQWMWKIQHPQGNREINELHVPVGKPVKLIMTSQDVIHSFFVPEFRIKQDVLPGRYTTQWFQATKAGTFHLFCAEYCGTSHSGMIGKVIVMEPADYEEWLAGKTGQTMSSGGEQLFQQFGCQTCHRPGAGQRGPSLEGLWGKQVKLGSGALVTADQNYIRESIINPGSKVVSGYQVLMPLYRNQLSEDQVNQLIEYIKSLSAQEGKSGL